MAMFKVTVKQGDDETVYVCAAAGAHKAKSTILQLLGGYHTADGGKPDSLSAVEMSEHDTPIKLYTINRKTGEMT